MHDVLSSRTMEYSNTMVTPTKLEQHIQDWAAFTFINYVCPPSLIDLRLAMINAPAIPLKTVRLIANWITMMSTHRAAYYQFIGALSAYDMATIFAVAYCYNDMYKEPFHSGELYEWGRRLAGYFNTNKLGVIPMDVIDLLRHNWWDTQRCEWCMAEPIDAAILNDCLICGRTYYAHEACELVGLEVCPLCTTKSQSAHDTIARAGESLDSLRYAMNAFGKAVRRL